LGKAGMNADFVISTDRTRLDLEFVVNGIQSTYWASTRSRGDVISSLEHSLCFGAFESASGQQVGFARVVTDGITFSWLCDVFVDPRFRGRGIGKMLVAEIVAHPEVKRTNSYLGTKDAHSLYEGFGFQRWEIMRRDKKAAQPEH